MREWAFECIRGRLTDPLVVLVVYALTDPLVVLVVYDTLFPWTQYLYQSRVSTDSSKFIIAQKQEENFRISSA